MALSRPRPSAHSVTCSGFIVFGFVALSLAVVVAAPHSVFKRGVSSR